MKSDSNLTHNMIVYAILYSLVIFDQINCQCGSPGFSKYQLTYGDYFAQNRSYNENDEVEYECPVGRAGTSHRVCKNGAWVDKLSNEELLFIPKCGKSI